MRILKDLISLKFKTTQGDGVLLHGEGQQGDYITLELKRAKLWLQINLGNLGLSHNLTFYCPTLLCESHVYMHFKYVSLLKVQ